MNRYILFVGILIFTRLASAQVTAIPVDQLTGKLSLTIPITEVSEGTVNVPVFLRYLSGGVGVSDKENTAGMSWELRAGGAVVREVRGLPDDFSSSLNNKKGWLKLGSNPISSISNADGCATENSNYTTIDNLGYDKDTEPDLFAFYAPGISGQFMFDETGTPRLIPFQDLKIEPTFNSNSGYLTSFTITTSEGVKYLFSAIELTTRTATKPFGASDPTYFKTKYEYYKGGMGYYSAWNLYTITSPEANTISFQYQLSDTDTQTDIVSYYTQSQPNTSVELYRVADDIRHQQLTKITTTLEEIEFEWEGINRIKEITLKDLKYDKERTFRFHYVQAKDSNNPASAAGNLRAFLTDIIQQGECSTYPSYRFDYYGLTQNQESLSTIALPFESGNQKDYWGFKNATSEATTEAPPVYVVGTETGAKRYRIYPLNVNDSPTYSGGSRFATGTASIVRAASLERVVYPTGSNVTIEYEPNTYFDEQAGRDQYGAGIRVSKVTVSDVEHDSEDIVTEYDYTLDGTNTSGKLINRPVLAFEDGSGVIRTDVNRGESSYVLYTKTQVKQLGRGKTIYEFNVPSSYPKIAETGEWIDWHATESRLARSSGNCPGTGGNQQNGFYAYPYPPNTNYDFERGLPHLITDYDESGHPVMIREFSYQRLPSPITYIKGLRYEKQAYSPGNYVFGLYTLLTNTDRVIAIEKVRRIDELNPGTNFDNLVETSTSYTYSSVHSLLESMSTTNSDNVTHKTKYKYAKDLNVNASPTSLEAKGIRGLIDNSRGGTVIETIQSRNDGTEVITGASLTLYKLWGTKILPYQYLSFPQKSGFTETGTKNGGAELNINTSYIPTSTILSYSDSGLPLSLIDNRQNESGFHYGFSSLLPLAVINNAAPGEVVHSGFESNTPYSLYPVTSSTSSNVISFDGFPGIQSFSMTSSTVLTKSSLTKEGNLYSASCLVTGSNATTIYFRVKNGSTIITSGSVTYGSEDLGQWKYLQLDMDITDSNNSFTLEVTSSANITLTQTRFQPYVSQAVSQDSWAGNLAYQMTQSTVLRRLDVQKGGNKYRASCMVKGALASIVSFTVKDGATVVSTGTMNYTASDLNKWKYLETTVDISGTSSIFTLEVSSSEVINIDEIKFQPYDSDVTTYSYDILNGQTAQVDNRGNAVFTEYDVLGRPYLIKNKNKDIVQVKEYRFKREATPIFSSEFTGGGFEAGQSTQLISVSNCSSGLTYQWYLNGNLLTGSDGGHFNTEGDKNYINLAISTPGSITVKLIVSHSSGLSSQTERQFCVQSPAFQHYITVVDVPQPGHDTNISVNNYLNCHNNVKLFSISSASGGCGAPVTYTWKLQYYDTNLNLHVMTLGNTTQVEVNCMEIGVDFQVWCEATQTCSTVPGTCQPANTTIIGLENSPNKGMHRLPDIQCQ